MAVHTSKRGRKRIPTPATRSTPSSVAGWAVPPHLKEEAATAWDHAVKLLRATGNLSRTDPFLVECYAINYGVLRKAQAAVDADGVMIKNRLGGPIPHPGVNAISAATMRLKAIINDLGLCPASSKHAAATVIATPDASDKDEQEWNDVLGIIG